MVMIKIITQKFSPSAFHQGNVHGCFSAKADLLISDPPSHTKSVIVARGRTKTDKNLVKRFIINGVMRIDEQKCVACGNCISVCPMGAISIDPLKNRATVNADECVECYTCYRGMSMEKLNPTFVRLVRRVLKA